MRVTSGRDRRPTTMASSGNPLRTKGIEQIQLAQGHEGKREWREAHRCYKQGCEMLLSSLKYDQDKTAQEVIRKHVSQYVDRIEQIEKLLEEEEKQASRKSARAASSSTSNDDELHQKALDLVLSEKLAVKWDDIAGLVTAKEDLKQAVIYPISLPKLFENNRVRAWSGILLYGPPGTGKTLLAKAVATESGACTFMQIQVASIMSRWVGDSERMIAEIFKVAREKAPTVIFFDEIDSIATQRTENDHDVARKVKIQLLTEMDGLSTATNKRVLVLAATNTPWSIDLAFMRRFQRRVYIPLPDVVARRRIFEIAMQKLGTDHQCLTAADLDELAAATELWSGSDLDTLIGAARNMSMQALVKCTHFQRKETTEGTFMVPCGADAANSLEISLDEVIKEGWGNQVMLPPVSRADFDMALRTTRAVCTSDDLVKFEQFSTEK